MPIGLTMEETKSIKATKLPTLKPNSDLTVIAQDIEGDSQRLTTKEEKDGTMRCKIKILKTFHLQP